MPYMMQYGGMSDHMIGFGLPFIGSFFLLAIAWSLVWKGLALWRAAQRKEKWWFIAFLLINTLGILEIVYIFAITGGKISDFTGGTKEDESAPKEEHKQ